MSRAAERLSKRAGNVLCHLSGHVYELQHVDSWALGLVGRAELEGSALYHEALSEAHRREPIAAAKAAGATDEEVEPIAQQHAKVAARLVRAQMEAAVRAPGGAKALRARMDAYVMAAVVGVGFVRPDVAPLDVAGKASLLPADWSPDGVLEDLAEEGQPPRFIDPLRFVDELPAGPGSRADKLAALAARDQAWLHTLTPETVSALWMLIQGLSRGVEVPRLLTFRRGA